MAESAGIAAAGWGAGSWATQTAATSNIAGIHGQRLRSVFDIVVKKANSGVGAGLLPVAARPASRNHGPYNTWSKFPHMAIAPEERYSRQVLFSGIGAEGQEKLRAATVALVGCGATGSMAASLLVRAGVGTLRLVDRDYVEPSNLQRQALFDESDAAESLPKAVAAARKLTSFNSDVKVVASVADLTPGN